MINRRYRWCLNVLLALSLGPITACAAPAQQSDGSDGKVAAKPATEQQEQVPPAGVYANAPAAPAEAGAEPSEPADAGEVSTGRAASDSPGTARTATSATATAQNRVAATAAVPAETVQAEAEEDDPDWWKEVNWHALARRDKMEFLRQAQRRANQVTQFTATLSKQERIRGELRDKEVILMKWRAEPFSVYMEYEKGDKGREVLYVEGKRNNNVLVKLGGLLGFVVVEVDPHGEQAMKDNLRPVTMAGLPNILNTSMPDFIEAERNDDLTVQYLGRLEINGRRAYTIKRILPKKDIYPCKELVIFIDVETLVPVGADTYDWDGQLESRYRYSNIDLDPDLTNEDFSRENDDYGF